MLRRVEVDRDTLLMQAYRRVVARKDIEKVIADGGAARDEVLTCLEKALCCVRELADPAAAVLATRQNKIGEDPSFGHEVLARSMVRAGATDPDSRAYLYLMTCGYDSREAMRRLNSDYVSYHFQNSIGCELLFALGRLVARSVRDQARKRVGPIGCIEGRQRSEQGRGRCRKHSDNGK